MAIFLFSKLYLEKEVHFGFLLLRNICTFQEDEVIRYIGDDEEARKKEKSKD
jgi:hypothetical protein